MAEKGPSLQEARLQKLKEEIALRKQQRQQKLLQQSQDDAKLSSSNQKIFLQRETTPQKTALLSPKNKTPEQKSSLKVKTPRKKSFQNDEPSEHTPAEIKKETQSESKNRKCESLQKLSESKKSPKETEKLSSTKTQTKTKKQRSSQNLLDSDSAQLPNGTENDTLELTSSPKKVKKAKKRKSSETEQSLIEADETPLRPSQKAKRMKKQSLGDADLSSNETEEVTSGTASCKSKREKRQRLSDADKMLEEFAKECPGKVSYMQQDAGGSDKGEKKMIRGWRWRR